MIQSNVHGHRQINGLCHYDLKIEQVNTMENQCEFIGEYQGHNNKKTCTALFNCCDCGGNECGCIECFSCNACEYCLEDES